MHEIASLTLDPLNANTLQALSIMLYLDRDYAAAIMALRKSIAINPTIDYSHYLLGVIQLLSGHNDEAIKESRPRIKLKSATREGR